MSLADGAAAAAAAKKQAKLDAGLTSSFTAGLGAGAKKGMKAESWRAKNQHGGGGGARAELISPVRLKGVWFQIVKPTK